MKLYTKGGDDGSTMLFNGDRVAKCNLRVDSYGHVDELNAFVGVTVGELQRADARPEFDSLLKKLNTVQHQLFDIGADLATPLNTDARQHIRPVEALSIGALEGWIDEAAAASPELKSFVLPGGSVVSAHLHVCRTICRRAERAVVNLAGQEEINEQVIIYLNRLSDLMFAWARWVNHVTGDGDVVWKGR